MRIVQEFASMGPMGFDLGCLLGVLLLAYIVLQRQPSHANTVDSHKDKSQQCAWLLGAICEIWRQLELKFQQHHLAGKAAGMSGSGNGSRSGGRPGGKVGSRDGLDGSEVCSQADGEALLLTPHSSSVWQDTLGFAAFCMIRLTIGMHSYPGYEFLSDKGTRTRAELDALDVAQELLCMRDRLVGVAEQEAVVGGEYDMEHVVQIARRVVES